MTRFLVTQGADVNYTNSHGETLVETLANGEADAISAEPSNAIFVRERFRLCRKCIRDRHQFLVRERLRGIVDYRPRRPRRVDAALKIWSWWISKVRPQTVCHDDAPC